MSSTSDTEPYKTPSPTSVQNDGVSLLELSRYQIDAASMSLANAYTMYPTIDERAEGFFYTTYVVDSYSQVAADSIFGPGVDEVVLSSMKAVGLASLANYARTSDLTRMAKKQYLAAIRLVNAALMSPMDVKKDSTLLTTIILSIYETISGDAPRSLTAWKDHLHGAAALLALRGPEQLSTLKGRRMFTQVMNSLVVVCMQYDIELPDHIMDLRAEAAKHLGPNNLVLQYQEAMVLLTNFRARVKRGITTEPHLILARALELDAMFVSMFSDVPASLAYQTVYTDADPDVILFGCYHVYQDFLVSQIWNGMRNFRVLLNEMIRNVLLAHFFSDPTQPASQEHVAQYQRSTGVLYQMQLDIIASVPQHLGYPSMLPTWTFAHLSATDDWAAHKYLWLVFNVHRAETSTLAVESRSTNLPVVRLSGGHHLVWALYVAAVTDVTTERVRSWGIEMLGTMGRLLGIKQAAFLANAVANETDVGVWQTQQEARHPQLRKLSKLHQLQEWSEL